MLLIWLGFLALIILLLMLDLGVFHRHAREVRIREALVWTAIWVAVALAFNVAVYFLYEYHLLGIGIRFGHALSGREAALQYLTGYLLEESLSVDNMFVIAMIFAFFAVPAAYQHRVLFWGILGALIMRGIMIGAGTEMVRRFEWTTYVFGALLILTAVKMLRSSDEQVEPDRNILVRLARRLYPVTPCFHGQKFFVRVDGRRAITPLFLVLLVIESSDLLFAVDSIPAVIAVSRDPFIVFTSNIFAILGLRSIYFALAGMMDRFRYLKLSLVFLLAFIGGKMLLAEVCKIPTPLTLAITAGILSAGALASLIATRREQSDIPPPLTEGLGSATRFAWRHARRVVVLIVGTTVLLVGIALIFLPGPAFVVIPIGLGILAVEFVWAQRLLAKARGHFDRVSGGSTAAGALAMTVAATAMLVVGYLLWLGDMALAVRHRLGPTATWPEQKTAFYNLVANGHWKPVPAAIFSSFGVGLLFAVIGVALAIRSIRLKESKRGLAIAACILGMLMTLGQVLSTIVGLLARASSQ